MNRADTAPGRVGALIVNYNAGAWLERCVGALTGEAAGVAQIVIVDNGSNDGSLDGIAGERVRIDRAGANLGFAAGINRAAAQCDCELLLLLNPDCRIEADDLRRLVAELDAHPDAALVSGRVVGEDGAEQRGSRRRLPTPATIIGEMFPFSSNGIDLGRTPRPDTALDVDAVSGACMLVRATAFHAVDGLDSGYRLHFEDLDLFARLAAAGYRLRWVPDVRIVHAGGRSSASRPAGVQIDKHRGLWRYLQRHCRDQWPAWQRPLWALALLAHLGVRLAIALPRAALRRLRRT